jgi:hypothetical protein
MVGPRYLARALHQIYFPLDRELVREMWVLGDLKDQLGVEHRYRRKKQPNEVEIGDRQTFAAESRSESSVRLDGDIYSNLAPNVQSSSSFQAGLDDSGRLLPHHGRNHAPRGDDDLPQGHESFAMKPLSS